MNKKKSDYEESEESEELTNLETLDAYVEASEMYLEAIKLDEPNNPNGPNGYIIGMKALYIVKAYLAFTNTDNVQAIRKSLLEALTAYTTVFNVFQPNGIGKQFIYTSELIIKLLQNELHRK
jgi:hypothetical protein